MLAAVQIWLGASDIHVDPFSRSPDPGTFGADTNLALFRSSLAAMRRAVPSPPVVVLGGDFFMHQFPSPAERDRTIRIVAGDFAHAFPHAQFVITLGNNDSACGDYRSDLGSSDLSTIARVWAPLVNRYGRAPNFSPVFGRFGHYTARSPQPGVRFVVVDSVLFSSLYRGDCNGNADAPARELDWLARTLAATPPDVRNVVVMHVPPGYDVFATALAHGFVPWTLMRPKFNEGLARTLADPRNRVALVLTGHVHHFDVRVDGDVPIVTLGSISPVYGNAPAFYALSVDDAGGLRDVGAWAFDEPSQQWLGPFDFVRTFGVTRLDSAALREIHDRLDDDTALRERWERAFDGWAFSQSGSVWSGKRWRIAWCAQTELDGGFVQCARLERRQIAAWIALAAIPIAVLCALVTLVLLVRRRRIARA